VSVYLLLKYLHVLLAIVAVGFNASYPVWLARVRRDDRAVERSPVSPRSPVRPLRCGWQHDPYYRTKKGAQ
jgi:hypothetical protein